MPTGLLPRPATDGAAPPTDPRLVVEAFLAALADSDLDAAAGLVDEHIDYVNVGLPRVKGRAQMARVFALFANPSFGFEAYLHAVSAEGPVVLTERTDVILLGPVRIQFWVWGRFDVNDGRITLWRDSFDFVDVFRGMIRGLAGVIAPWLRPTPPVDVDAEPGR